MFQMARFSPAHIPASLFLLLGTAMNMRFAWENGTDDFARLLGIGISIGAASCIAIMPGTIRANWRAGSRWGWVCATLFLLAALGWEGHSGYAFYKQQFGSSTSAAADSARKRSDAEAAVRRATDSLTPYLDAPDLAVARADATALKSQIQVIDRMPGVIWKGEPCKRLREAEVIRYCDQRSGLERELTAANTAVARAEAKSRLQLELEKAQAQLNALPKIEADPRAGKHTEWLLVALLLLGAAAGFFAVPHQDGSRSPKFDRTGQEPDRGAPKITPAQEPRQRRSKGQAGRSAVAARLAEVAANPPPGVIVDRDGYVRGTQRDLAAALGYRRSVATFNRDLHEAAAAGDVQLDMSRRGTAVRVKDPA